MEGDGDNNVAEKAQHIWAMLDNMANSDPAAYRRFIDKHLKEGQEVMAPPEPHMCVQTSYQKLKDKTNVVLYINICEWKRIPAPNNETDPIPISGGAIYNIRADVACSQAIALAFNPSVLKECGRDAGMREEQTLLIHLCLDYIDKQFNLKVMRSYSVLPHKVTHKGTLPELRKCLMHKTNDIDEQDESDLEAAFGTKMKDSLLNELANITINEDVPSPIDSGAKNPPATTDSLQGIHILSSPTVGNKNLIEEISPNPLPIGTLPEPEYDLRVKDSDDTRPRRLLLRIRLPDVSSVEKCSLDIATDDVHLTVADRYDLTVTFPEKVNSDNASAKFSKKTGTLTLTVPTNLT